MYEGIEDKVLKECQYCGSKLIRKSGILPTGYQRYHCRECGKKFSVLTNIKFRHKSGSICPYCHSEYTRKAGFLKDGTQRYVCNTCNRKYSDKTVVKERIKWVCPKCRSHKLRREGKTKDGEQRYYCKLCRSVFTPTKVKKIYKVECPKCHTKEAIKWDKVKSRTGKPYYRCTNCHHKFVEGGKLALTEKQKQMIPIEYQNGEQVRNLAIKYKRTEETIRARVKDCNHRVHIKFALERLSPQVKRDIIYFGLGARVPVSYLSEYLKVDKEIINIVTKNYLKEVKKDK